MKIASKLFLGFIIMAFFGGINGYVGYLQVINISELDDPEKLEDEIDKTLGSMVLLSSISVLLAIGIGFFISFSISIPLKKLESSAKEVAQGNLDVKISHKKNDEIGELALQFDDMRKSIKKSNEKLTIQTKELELAYKELKQIDKQKEEFSSMITHELKTPLTPIRGYCEILKDESFGNLTQDQIHYVEKINSSAGLLERLIGDVLNVQKLDMEKMSFNKESFDVCNFLNRLKQDCSYIMKAKGIEFVVTSSVKTTLKTDQLRLLQILENLIINSVDFVPSKNGKIEVGIKQEGGKMIFHVKDNGSGIPKDKQRNIFKKFYQVDTSHTRKHGGTGLGLVICRGIVNALGGEIWFESEPGKGTTFYFSIPIYGLKITILGQEKISVETPW